MGDIFGIAIVRPLGLILLGIFKLIGNYGLAVILFALLVKLLCMPLTIKSKKSMLKMSAMNAELQQLQKRYANNRVKLNEEMTKLYEKHGVSPTSGCLPQLIPLFIMMGLYYAVQQPLKFMMGFGDEVISQLANLVGVDMATAGYYGQIEVGTSQMSVDTLIKLSKTSRLSMEYILLGEEIPPSADLAAIEALLARCTPREVRLAEKVLRLFLLRGDA